VLDWDRFVADFGPPTLRLACRILGHGPDAEDVVQEAFLQVYQISQNEEVSSWGGLLHRAALCRSLDRVRRRRTSGSLTVEPLSREDDPQEAAAAHELADQLRQAIGRLPQQQAAAFCMRYFDDQPYEQIAENAENLGVAVGAVASALHKARGKLKSMLAVSIKED
jgi:RNA polymerase sigma-70 factor (ECF subfamily)